MMRRTIRTILAAGILVFGAYTLVRIHAGAPEAPILAAAAAILLLVLFYALGRRHA